MNINTKYLVFALTLGLTVPGYSLFAEEQVYGWQLMSEQERQEHRTKMQNMNSEQEREQYRVEHHKQMQERAKTKGVTLPDNPGTRGMGGGGMGQGGGGKGR